MACPQTQRYNENNTRSPTLLVDSTLARYQALQSRNYMFNVAKHCCWSSIFPLLCWTLTGKQGFRKYLKKKIILNLQFFIFLYPKEISISLIEFPPIKIEWLIFTLIIKQRLHSLIKSNPYNFHIWQYFKFNIQYFKFCISNISLQYISKINMEDIILIISHHIILL